MAISIAIITLPISLIITIAIKLESEGPVLFLQPRTGLKGIDFTLYKFRTMTVGNDVRDLTKTNQKTKVGRVLRALSLDEIPQVINILKGEMSFIGPRPWIPEYFINMNDMQRKRVAVLPGMTGLAQVNGRNNLTIHEKIKFDLDYIENISFKKDVEIIFLTLKTVLDESNQKIEKLGIYNEIQALKTQQRRSGERG